MDKNEAIWPPATNNDSPGPKRPKSTAPWTAALLAAAASTGVAASSAHAAHEYIRVAHSRCGTPAMAIQDQVYFGAPIVMLLPIVGCIAARAVRAPARIASLSTIGAVAVWIYAIVVIKLT